MKIPHYSVIVTVCIAVPISQPEATALCSRSFPSESFALRINTPGDLAAVTLSTMILNDLPAADPRWNEATRHGR